MKKLVGILFLVGNISAFAQCWNNVFIGGRHTYAFKTDGTLWYTGDNTYGQLGDGTNVSKFEFTTFSNNTVWSTLAVGEYFSLGLKIDGTLWAWGYNQNGQLGDNTLINKNIPVQIGTANDWLKISAGRNHSLAIKNNGTLWAWGSNFNSKEDVRAFSGKTLNFYTKSTEEDLIIDAQNTFHENKIIPLGITSFKNDNQEYTIGIEKATGELKNVSIFLEDKSLGKIIDITTKPYSFKLNNLINDDRFLLKFDNKKSIVNTGLLNDINFVYNVKGLEIISLTKNIKSIVINDIYTSTINASEIKKIENINSKKAFIRIDDKYKMISIKVTLEDGSIMTKKMIK